MIPRIIYNSWLARILKVGAITLYPYIFIAPHKDLSVIDGILKHEMVHIGQVVCIGWWRFYISYILYWFAGLARFGVSSAAYYQIPYEVEAYNTEKE